MAEKFLELQHVGVQFGGGEQLIDVCLTIHRGEQWALIGHSGSGKTLLAHAVAGKNFFTGQIRYFFRTMNGNKSSIHLVDQQHRFKNLSNTAELYYQQRYNSIDSEQTATVEQELKKHFPTGVFINNEWLDVLEVRQLLQEPLIQLSNGENKRVQLVIALLERPELLILDNPFTGLDVEGRKILHDIVQSISQKGIQLLFITGNKEIPESITHIACLEKGKLVFKGSKSAYKQVSQLRKPAEGVNPLLWNMLSPAADQDFRFAVKMLGVNIRYGEKQVLQDIHWEVKKGERWNLSGPNGAGKSTLLSLITADNPQAYANEIYLFDVRRGTGESIWDIKRKIGFVSPELHLYFDFSATCFEVIASGLFDTIGLFRHLSETQQQQVMRWVDLLQLGRLQSKRLSQLAISEQRKTLLARALIKNPPLLILDEPCQGLDDEQADYFNALISEVCLSYGATLIYVSHYQHQVPACVGHFLHLQKGRNVF